MNVDSPPSVADRDHACESEILVIKYFGDVYIYDNFFSVNIFSANIIQKSVL